MLIMRATEDPTDPIRKLISSQKTVRFHDLALSVYPFGLYGVQPRALFRQKTAYDPHSFTTLLDLAVMPSEPASDFSGDVPGSVVPDEEQNLPASRFELLATPLKELGGYGTHRPAIHESQPRVADLGQVESVAGDSLRLGIVFGDRPLNEAKGLVLLAPSVQGGQSHPAPPAFILETDGPFGVGPG